MGVIRAHSGGRSLHSGRSNRCCSHSGYRPPCRRHASEACVPVASPPKPEHHHMKREVVR
jgi:hypothetical protein